MKKGSRFVAALGLLLWIGLGKGAAAQGRALPEEIERTDLLTYAQGVLFVGQTGLSSGSAAAALLAIDGDPYRLGLTSDRNGPAEFTYKLPAETTFDRFAIPNVVEQPGNTTFVKSVTVSGSAEGPDSGYRVLASFELETHGPDEEVTEVTPEVVIPVRWIKVRFEGGILIEPGHEGRTVIWFSELIGNGRQEVLPLATVFDGVWDLRLTERTDARGVPLLLRQTGATITGCHGNYRLTGTVNGRIARATGEDDRGRPGAFIFVADDDDDIQASVSINNSLFGARTAVVDGPCGSTLRRRSTGADRVWRQRLCQFRMWTSRRDVAVNFDVDSAASRNRRCRTCLANWWPRTPTRCRSKATRRPRVRPSTTWTSPLGALRPSSTT